VTFRGHLSDVFNASSRVSIDIINKACRSYIVDESNAFQYKALFVDQGYSGASKKGVCQRIETTLSLSASKSEFASTIDPGIATPPPPVLDR
jgi:hypothetical protein